MTHYDITMGDDVAMDDHYDIIMCHDIVMANIMMLQYILMLEEPSFSMYYYVQLYFSVFLVKSLKLYVKH